MQRAEELRHLRSGPRDEERPGGAGLVEVLVEAVDPRTVLAQAREVLLAVVEDKDPPGSRDLPVTLPTWFVGRCAPPRSEAEDQHWLGRRRELDPAARAAAERERGWTLSEWLHWFQPGERSWWWWSAEVEDDHHLRVRVQVVDWPAPFGALVWLLQVAGASSVEVDA